MHRSLNRNADNCWGNAMIQLRFNFRSPLLVMLTILALTVPSGVALAFCEGGGEEGAPYVVDTSPSSLTFSSGIERKKVTISNTGTTTWSIFLWEVSKQWTVIDEFKKCLMKEYKPKESCVVEIEHSEAGSGHKGTFRVRVGGIFKKGEDSTSLSS